jgi:serine/threonine-protein kinase
VVLDEAAEMDAREEEEKRRNRKLLAMAAVAVAIAAIVIFALTRDTSTEVPKVTGNQVNVAVALLQQDGFDVGKIKRVQRESPVGTVLEQDPAPAPPADEAALDCAFITFFCSKPSVDLTVSAGPGQATVPGTAGRPVGEATGKLEDAGFQVQTNQVNSDSVEEGLVINSDPKGGSSATRGSVVTLTVSAGPKLIKVPVLVGSQRSVAVQRIRGAGFTASVEEEESSAAKGEVISQSPSAGTRIPPGSTVSVVVSEGEEQATVPSVIGKLRSEAVEAIRAEGLSPTVSEQETAVPSKVGRVIDQFPPPGSEVEPGSTVTVVVGKAAAAEEEEGEGEIE